MRTIHFEKFPLPRVLFQLAAGLALVVLTPSVFGEVAAGRGSPASAVLRLSGSPKGEVGGTRTGNAALEFARAKLAESGKTAEIRVAPTIGHPEGFRIQTEGDKAVIEAGAGAGGLYGVQAYLDGDYEKGTVEKPDFDIRGTTLPLMNGGNDYVSTLSPKTFPWFFDKQFMLRALDTFAAARLNTIFVWAGHIFPYIVEMPDYPEASADVPSAQIKANQEQFFWFTTECERRNIRVLLHFYNIHVSPPFAKHHAIATNPSKPTPLLKEYTHYALTRYFQTFPSVGVYVCPGESLESKFQLDWFRDVIFDAAKKSGKNPVVVVRDWTLNANFRAQLKSQYDNVYSELKHNDESFTSPYPDVRHLQLEGVAKGHIVNVHGPAMDFQPMRWASPFSVQEAAQCWRKLGFVRGVEFYGTSFWAWPITSDKVAKGEPRLVSLDREAPFYAVFGRYLWKSDRADDSERAYWKEFYSRRFGSKEIGASIARWYEVTGSISPGLQNLNTTQVANFWASVLLMNQKLDQILSFNKRLDEVPYTLHRETGRAEQRYYPRPYDNHFFERYRQEFNLPKAGENAAMYKEFEPYKQRMQLNDLAQRHCMPVRQYAEYLERGEEVTGALTPDRVIRLLNKLALEALDLARSAVAAAKEGPMKAELQRFVTDSELYVLATEAMIHKEDAAILKARMLLSRKADKADALLRELEQSVAVYEQLCKLTDGTYHWGNDLRQDQRWSKQGIGEFRKDLEDHKMWISGFKAGAGVSGGKLGK